MAWNRTVIETETQGEIDDFESDTLTILRQFINDICRIIWFAHTWSWKETTGYIDTNGVAQAITISGQLTNVAQVLAVGFKGSGETAYRVLEFIPYKQFLQQYKNRPATVANPSVWTMYGGQIIFDTIPPNLTDNVEVTYQREWVDLTDGTTAPLIPEKYKHVIKSGVKWLYYNSDDDTRSTTEEMNFHGQKWEKGVGGMIGDMIVDDSENPEGPYQHQAFDTRGIIFGGRR